MQAVMYHNEKLLFFIRQEISKFQPEKLVSSYIWANTLEINTDILWTITAVLLNQLSLVAVIDFNGIRQFTHLWPGCILILLREQFSLSKLWELNKKDKLLWIT